MKIKLKDYIDAIGVLKIAVICGVSTQAVYQWRAGVTYPRRDQAAFLIEYSKGALSFDSIYGGEQ